MSGSRVLSMTNIFFLHLTLRMASAQVVETSVTNNSPSQDSNHLDDLFQSRHVTPGSNHFLISSRGYAGPFGIATLAEKS